jgi:hypothetical protein
LDHDDPEPRLFEPPDLERFPALAVNPQRISQAPTINMVGFGAAGSFAFAIAFRSYGINRIHRVTPLQELIDRSSLARFDRHGQVVRHEFRDGVINSNERMTYTAVNGILTDRDPELLKQYAPLVPMFEKYHVTAAFFGHDHNYQHYLKNDIHYVVTGGGGAPLYDVDKPPDGITVKVASTENFVKVKVDGKSAHVEAIAVDGTKLDQIDRLGPFGAKPNLVSSGRSVGGIT